jgi:hypothetical protein
MKRTCKFSSKYSTSGQVLTLKAEKAIQFYSYMHINSIDTIPEVLIPQPQAASLHVTDTSGHCSKK